MTNFISMADLEASLAEIEKSPSQEGAVDLIVCRPQKNARQELDDGELTIEEGLIGDNWKMRVAGSKNQSVHQNTQLTLMNSRVIAAITKNKDRWQLAGDQFYVNFDLSKGNIPSGTRLKIGTAIIEVAAEPHLGCKKFAERFGKDAVKFVNSTVGQLLNLRGINARVIVPGNVTMGSCIEKVEA
ncbi:MAG: MOSC domain-containing protein [Gammaproteobacteria bacterium]|nr:MOSC domain-containing protein [Gammaproteobacteria bacterium]MCK5091105.1 MOSC domain-containing protein [Gammaproteobacteria bacterium]